MDQIKNLFNKTPPANQNKNQFHPVPQFIRDNNNPNMNRNKFNFSNKPNQLYHSTNKDIQMVDTNNPQRQMNPNKPNLFQKAINTGNANQYQSNMNRIKNNLKKFAEKASNPKMQRKPPLNFNEVPQDTNMNINTNQGFNQNRGLQQGTKKQYRKRIHNEFNTNTNPSTYYQEEDKGMKSNYHLKSNYNKERNYDNQQEDDDNDTNEYYNEDYDINELNDEDITNEYYPPKPKKVINQAKVKPLNKSKEKSNKIVNSEENNVIKQKIIKKKPNQYLKGREKEKETSKDKIEKTYIDISKINEIQEKKKRSMSPSMPNILTKLEQSKEDNPSSIIKGQLTKMCSEREVIERESQNLLSIFEIDHSKTTIDPRTNLEIKKAKQEYAIKAYLRPGGDLNKYDFQNIRTPNTLRETVNFIINNIVDSDLDVNSYYNKNGPIAFSEICLFANDRFKAIRQDFIVQELKSNKECIESNELIARFLILCLNETLDEKSISGKQGLYELNMVQLNSTLASLYEYYEFSRNEKDKGVNDDYYISPNEDEFIAYFLLIALKQKPIEFISILSKIPKQMQKGRRIALALSIAKTILNHDWNGFMKILKSKECDYLISCIMLLFFTDIRFLALTELSYLTQPSCAAYLVSINLLLELLPFEDIGECLEFLEWFGIKIPYSVFDNPNEKFKLHRENMSNDYKFIYAPMKTNHKYIQVKKNKLSRREVIIGTRYHNIPFDKNNLLIQSHSQMKSIKVIDTIKIKPKEEEIVNNSNKQQTLFITDPSITLFKSNQNEQKKDNQVKIKSEVIKGYISFKQDQTRESIEDNKHVEIFNTGRTQYLMSILELVSKVYLIRHKYTLLSQIKLYLEQDKIVHQFQKGALKKKKRMLILAWRKAHIQSKYNKVYQKELLKYNMNINSIQETYSMQPKANLSLYNYDEMLYFLIDKYEQSSINQPKSINDNSISSNEIIHLQINFYTTRDLLISTNIIQRLNINNDNVQSSTEEIIISSRIKKGEKTFWFFMKLIFIEEIIHNSIENYIFLHQQSLGRFTYGLVFFEYTNDTLLKAFITLIDQSLGKYIKKKFIFGFCIENTINNEQFNLLHKSYLSLVDKYHYTDDNDYTPRTVFFANLNSFSSYFTDLLIHHNNSAFISLFKEEANKVSFQLFDLNSFANEVPFKRIQKMIKTEYNMRSLKQSYRFSISNYLIEETLLSIAFIKTIALFYMIKLSNDVSIMMNIPSYITESWVENREMIYMQLIKFFDYIRSIDISNIAYRQEVSKCYMESPLAYFDILFKHLIDYDFTDVFGSHYNEALTTYEFNAKKQFSLSIANGMSRIVLGFFNEVIGFVSDSIEVKFNWSSDDYRVFEKIFNEKKEKSINEVMECMNALIDNGIIPTIKMNERLSHDYFPHFNKCIDNDSSQKFYLNKKRRRFHASNFEYEKQLSMQIISYSKDNFKSYFNSTPYSDLNHNSEKYIFQPNLVQYISQ